MTFRSRRLPGALAMGPSMQSASCEGTPGFHSRSSSESTPPEACTGNDASGYEGRNRSIIVQTNAVKRMRSNWGSSCIDIGIDILTWHTPKASAVNTVLLICCSNSTPKCATEKWKEKESVVDRAYRRVRNAERGECEEVDHECAGHEAGD